MLLDVVMPGGMDGFETCRCLKQNPLTRDIPVLFLTVLDQTIDKKVSGICAGGLDFISKPVEHARSAESGCRPISTSAGFSRRCKRKMSDAVR